MVFDVFDLRSVRVQLNVLQRNVDTAGSQHLQRVGAGGDDDDAFDGGGDALSNMATVGRSHLRLTLCLPADDAVEAWQRLEPRKLCVRLALCAGVCVRVVRVVCQRCHFYGVSLLNGARVCWCVGTRFAPQQHNQKGDGRQHPFELNCVAPFTKPNKVCRSVLSRSFEATAATTAN